MREKFHSLWDLMGYYQYLKFNVDGCATILPMQTSNFKNKYSVIAAQSTREEKLCFIADIEMFVRAYASQQKGYSPIPLDCLTEIFLFTFAPDLWLIKAFPYKAQGKVEWTDFKNKFCTFGQLAKLFKRRIINNEKIPRRLGYREYLCDLCSDMKKKAEIFFCELGMIYEHSHS